MNLKIINDGDMYLFTCPSCGATWEVQTGQYVFDGSGMHKIVYQCACGKTIKGEVYGRPRAKSCPAGHKISWIRDNIGSCECGKWRYDGENVFRISDDVSSFEQWRHFAR